MENKLKMTELAHLTGVSKSTIHHYLNLGLLHPPEKVGLNLLVYDWTHLIKLKRIRELRKNQKLPLSRIKEVLSNEDLDMKKPDQEEEAETLIRALEDEKRITRARKNEKKRLEIVDAAITLFSQNGYENTTLETIANSLHMAKSTIYLYFENKETLFMECIERLTMVAVPEKSWDEIRKEKHALKRLKKRGIAFHKAFPSYKGILTMTKAALGGNNDRLSVKAKNTFSLMTRPMIKDLRRGMADGLFRKIDEELVAHFFLAMGEALGFRLMIDSRYTMDQAIEIMFDFVSHGLLKKNSFEHLKSAQTPVTGDVTDLKGVVTKVNNIRFEGEGYLKGKIGEAETKIDPAKVDKIRFLHRDSPFSAEITAKDGKMFKVEVDNTQTLSGELSLGKFSIELDCVSMVVFER